MKLILVRHGDPDYEKDSLTEKGFREAKLLVDRIVKIKPDKIYVSPLGRAKDTAAPSLEALGMSATELPWLEEFRGRCIRPDVNKEMISWDFMPDDWTEEPLFYDRDRWMDAEVFKGTNVKSEYEYVIENFDAFLKELGYERQGGYYRVTKPNKDTVVLFCHYAVSAVMISRLLGVSPMILWHGLVAAPTSVTTITTEERREGKAIFRMSGYGDISHLYAADEPPAFAARFCEVFTDDTRH